jgi:hypothetical protein
MYRTKKISDVKMLSSANVKLYHKCGHMGLRGGIKAGGQLLVGNEADDTQHGTRVDGSSHPCTGGHHPK